MGFTSYIFIVKNAFIIYDINTAETPSGLVEASPRCSLKIK